MKNVCLYHAVCFDGFGAAYALWKTDPDALFIPVGYGQPLPELPPGIQTLYLFDFTYPRDQMERLKQVCNRLVVLDHHVTTRQALEGFECDTLVFDMDHSGAYLAYQYLHPGEPVPTLYRYLEDRDLWRFDRPDSRAINAYIQSFDWEFDVWVEMDRELNQNPAGCRQAGEAILRFQQHNVDMICDQAHVVSLGGHPVPVVNATAFWSEVGHTLLERHPDVPFVASYCDLADGQRMFSLRCRDGFDVSQVAKGYGGGGHAKAAGFKLYHWGFPS